MKSLRRKLLGSFFIVIALVGGLCTFNYVSVTKFVNETKNIINDDLPLLISDEELAFNIAQRTALVRGYILYNEPSYKELFLQYTEESKETQELILAESHSEQVKELIRKSIEWREIIEEEVFEEFENGDKDEALLIMSTKVQPLARELMVGFKNIATDRESEILSEGKDVIASGDSVKNASLYISLFIILISIALSLFMAHSISKPVKKVANRMLKIADGNLKTEDLTTASKDETAQLIQATNTMNTNLKNVITNIVSASDNVKTQSSELTAFANEVQEGSMLIVATMEELASGTQEQAQSCADLSENISSFIENIKLSNQEGAELKSLTEQVKSATENGNHLMSVTKSNMNSIEHLVGESVLKVRELDGKTEKINDIISVITNISEQTNLLALNAAIEAARAGEHGKGFAVVANEVRKLAEEVKFSVNDITNIVHSVQKESKEVASSLDAGYKSIQNGSAQIKETTDTFDSISDMVKEMTGKVCSICSELEDFVVNGDTLLTSICTIASVSQESAAGIEETTASTEEASKLMEQILNSSQLLGVQSENLNRIVKQFSI